MCVCLSVCGHSQGGTVLHIIKKFGIGIDLDDILDEFDGQGQGLRSPGQKCDFQAFRVRVPGYKTLVSSMFMYRILHTCMHDITKFARVNLYVRHVEGAATL